MGVAACFRELHVLSEVRGRPIVIVPAHLRELHDLPEVRGKAGAARRPRTSNGEEPVPPYKEKESDEPETSTAPTRGRRINEVLVD